MHRLLSRDPNKPKRQQVNPCGPRSEISGRLLYAGSGQAKRKSSPSSPRGCRLSVHVRGRRQGSNPRNQFRSFRYDPGGATDCSRLYGFSSPTWPEVNPEADGALHWESSILPATPAGLTMCSKTHPRQLVLPCGRRCGGIAGAEAGEL